MSVSVGECGCICVHKSVCACLLQMCVCVCVSITSVCARLHRGGTYANPAALSAQFGGMNLRSQVRGRY